MNMKRRMGILLACCLCFTAAGAAQGEGFEMVNEIPASYLVPAEHGGTVEEITYLSKDYNGDQAEVTKHALVYLPPDYDETARYDLLILCHGIGGNEKEWGFASPSCPGRCAVDRLILNGEARPFIIVMPNGRSTANYQDQSMNNAQSFYVFGKELRNDLIPYMDGHYATWGSDYPGDLPAAREHRAMAGLSMGGMQTINIGLCECLDIISAFGAFSAAPTTYRAAQIAEKLKGFGQETIRYFYNVCGTEDGIAYPPASAAAQKLPDYTDRVTADNFCWQERSGEHNFDIWYLGLFNFARIIGR